MKKERLRFLALGFFIAALILSAFQLVFPADQMSDAENVAQGSDDYQEKYENLLVEYNQLFVKVSSDENKTEESHSAELRSEGSSAESSEMTEVVENTSQNSSGTPIVFLVHEGQPSSTVLQNLLQAGLIESVESAEAYLAEQNLLTAIQFGSYTLSTDMSDEEVLQTITVQ